MDTLQQVIDGIKQDSQTGQIGNNADQATIDILKQYNNAAIEFWGKNNWDWGKTAIALTIPANTTTEITLPATIGQLISMGIVGQPGELLVFSEHEWRKFRKSRDGTDVNGNLVSVTANSVYGYVKRGMDANGNYKLLFVEPSTSQTLIEGEGKTRLVGSSGARYVVADVATVLTPNFGYFIEESMPLLYDWALGRFLRAIKDVRGDGLLNSVSARVDDLMGTQRNEPMERQTTPPPDYVRFVNRKRGGRATV